MDVRLAGRTILDRVSFEIGAGEFTGLIGSNGAGKTTLFRVILGLQPTNAGDVLLAGRPRTRRGQPIGFVPQKFLLDPDLPLAQGTSWDSASTRTASARHGPPGRDTRS